MAKEDIKNYTWIKKGVKAYLDSPHLKLKGKTVTIKGDICLYNYSISGQQWGVEIEEEEELGRLIGVPGYTPQCRYLKKLKVTWEDVEYETGGWNPSKDRSSCGKGN